MRRASCFRRHLDRRPVTNPFVRFGAQLEQDLPRLLDGDATDYHAYAFATVRMAGSAFEAAASHIDWLIGDEGATASCALAEVVEGCKALSFRLARRRSFEPEPAITALAAAWTRHWLDSMTQSLEFRQSASPGTRARVEGHEVRQLSDGWQAAATPARSVLGPAELDEVGWFPAHVPGTAASALRDAGVWRQGVARDFDAEDWWFRTSLTRRRGPRRGGGAVPRWHRDRCRGLLNGQRVLESDSMFARHALDVGALLHGENQLTIRCRALAPLLRERRRPRARWRSRLCRRRQPPLLSHDAPRTGTGLRAGPAAVGPWREVRLERRRRVVVEGLALRASVCGEEGRLTVRACLRTLEGAQPVAAEIEARQLIGRLARAACAHGAGRCGRPPGRARGARRVALVAAHARRAGAV